MFSLKEQEIVNDFLDVIEESDKIREMKNTCQRLKFDDIDIAFIKTQHIHITRKSHWSNTKVS